MLDALNMEFYDRNIGGVYNNINLMEYFQREKYLVINCILRLDLKGGGETINDDDERCNFTQYLITVIANSVTSITNSGSVLSSASSVKSN